MPEDFWVLQPAGRRTAGWDRGNVWKREDCLGCPTSRGSGLYTGFGGPATRLTELRVILKTTQVSDFIWTIPDCLIRDHVLRAFREEGLTGFEAKPARARWAGSTSGDFPGGDDDGWLPEAPVCWEVLISGWGGAARCESGIVRIEGSNTWEGYPDWTRIVDWDAWDGSDFFFVWPFAFTRLVSNRVAEIIRRRNFTGVRLIKPEDYTRLHMWWEPNRITPMRLRDHFPEDRAREIGEPLGIY